jgi:hypothetical protein
MVVTMTAALAEVRLETIVVFVAHGTYAFYKGKSMILGVSAESAPHEHAENESGDHKECDDFQNKERHEEHHCTEKYSGEDGFENGSVHFVFVVDL